MYGVRSTDTDTDDDTYVLHMYMYSAYLYLAAVALAENDGLQLFALEYDMYSTCTLHGIHLCGGVPHLYICIIVRSTYI